MASPKTSRRQLPADIKNKLIGAIDAGESVAKAARHYHINENSACSIVKKYNSTGSTKNLPCSGRPLKMAEGDKCLIVQAARKQCYTPFDEITNDLGLDVSEQIVQNVLRQEGYHRHIARKVPFLTQHHRHLHVSWAWLYRLLTPQQWQSVIWSDKCYIYLHDDQRCIFVMRCADNLTAA